MTAANKPFVVIETDGIRQTIASPGDDAAIVVLPVPTPTAAELAESLVRAKGDRAALIERRRDDAINGGFTYGPGRFQSDPQSVRNIEGYVVSALGAEVRGEPWERSYRLADDRMVPIDGALMIEVGRAWERHKEASYVHSWTLKAAVEKARTIEAVKALDVDHGWPGSEEQA